LFVVHAGLLIPLDFSLEAILSAPLMICFARVVLFPFFRGLDSSARIRLASSLDAIKYLRNSYLNINDAVLSRGMSQFIGPASVSSFIGLEIL
jgi:hypothetical protein